MTRRTAISRAEGSARGTPINRDLATQILCAYNSGGSAYWRDTDPSDTSSEIMALTIDASAPYQRLFVALSIGNVGVGPDQGQPPTGEERLTFRVSAQADGFYQPVLSFTAKNDDHWSFTGVADVPVGLVRIVASIDIEPGAPIRSSWSNATMQVIAGQTVTVPGCVGSGGGG